MFDYPLKKRELFIFLRHTDDKHEFENALNQLIAESAVFTVGEFYSLHNNFELSTRRLKGNERASLLLKKAESSARLISKFPFVRGVSVSGSLSKNFADQNADIDFFIITAANRLWIARTFLHVFKKFTFLFNKQHLYCMNYFVDEAMPEIIEKNIYTATEIATVLPFYGSKTFADFYAANSWTKNFLPNNYMRISSAKEMRTPWFKFLIEKLCDNAVGNLFDNLLMKLTARSWKVKSRRKKKNSHGLIMGMKAGKHYSKPDPVNFQEKILRLYETNLANTLDQYDKVLRLTNESL